MRNWRWLSLSKPQRSFHFDKLNDRLVAELAEASREGSRNTAGQASRSMGHAII